MLAIGFFLSPSKDWLGGVNYFKNLFGAILAAGNNNIQLYIFVPTHINPDLLEMMVPESKNIVIVRTGMLENNNPYWYIWKLIRKLFKSDIVCLGLCWKYRFKIISHSNFINVPGVKIINWIADFQHVHLPHLFESKEIIYRNMNYSEIINGADIVLVSSETARKDIIYNFPKSTKKVRVLQFVSQVPEWYWRLDEVDYSEIVKKYELRKNYFYIPNQFWRHKNHSLLIHAARILKKENIDICLVCTGETSDYRYSNYFSSFTEELEKSFCKEMFRILGVVPYSDVFKIMRFSIAVINPSRFEGWSSTVEECKSAGKKVILSDIPVHREQMADADFFGIDNAIELAKHLKKFCENNNEILNLEVNKYDANISRYLHYGENILTHYR